LEDLKVPRVREGAFHPKILPYRRRASLELSEIIHTLYAGSKSLAGKPFARKGKMPGIGKKSSRTSSGAGSKGCGSFSPMIFPGWRRRSRGSFPKWRKPLRLPCRAGCAEQGAEEGPRSAG
jgi:hypothetical protein